MSDMMVQYVDTFLAERIRSLARERQCSINDVMLHALRNGLGISAARQYSESMIEPDALTDLGGHWEATERGVFQEALRALAQTRPTQLAPETIRYGESVGAE